MFFRLINHIFFLMVQCNKVDGKTCKCELEEPCIMYMVETIISNILKFVLGTISHAERDELRQFTRMPDTGRYLQIYIVNLDKHREIVGDVVLETI